ncbi:MAG: DUF5596 domain-containing protein [Clostridia bacterium]|nr:DUF5596 domain-containing protein [Clostridia bacterium]
MKRQELTVAEGLKWLNDFSERIELPEDSRKEIVYLYENECKHINRLKEKRLTVVTAQKILIREKILKKDKASLYLLAAVMLKAKDTLAAYREKNISDEIFYATMKDITVWSENFRREKGAVGIENLSWIQNHLNCKIFRLGRLQFQPFLFYLPPYVSKKKIINADIKIGEKVLNVHIPQGEKLSEEEFEKSFRIAEEFFKNTQYKAFICDSWLLCERNKEFMAKDSNILRFADMFDILGSSENSAQTIERVFGKKEKKPELYPENTSLQKRCKNYILSGGKPGTGFGIIRIKK